MQNSQTQNDKKILIVDDEIDILESLEELLEDTFVVDSASSFEKAVSCLKNNTYDAAILDIMGVSGYDLLEATNTLGIIILMMRSISLNRWKNFWKIRLWLTQHPHLRRLFPASKFMPLFDKFFGEGWKDPEKGFWDEFDKKHAGK
jgi:hypothetical protein